MLTYEGPLCATTVAETCTANVPATTDFAVKVAGTARSVSAVAVEGSTVQLTLSGNAIGATDAVTVAYTKPASNPLQDGNGNPPATFAERKADNISRLLVRNSGQGDTLFGNLGVDFAQAFTTGGSAFKLTRADLWMTKALASAADAAWTVSVHERGSDGLPGTSLGSLATSDTVPVGRVLARLEHANATGIDLAADTTYFVVVDASTGGTFNLIDLERSNAEDAGAAPGWSLGDGKRTRVNTATTWTGTTDAQTPLRIALHGFSTDTGAPTLQSLAVSGATLTLTFNENLDPGSVPAASAFAVTVAGAARAVSAVAVAGSKVTLTLASAVTAGQAVTLAYTAPSANPLRDVAAPHYNNAGNVSARNVRNDTGTLVSNTGQTSDGQDTVVGQLSSVHWSQAITFTTGGNTAGYTLSAVDVKLSAGTPASNTQVSIYTTTGTTNPVPSASLHVLNNPSSLTASAINTFSADAGDSLDANTTYAVVFEIPCCTGSTLLDRTASDAEDAGAASGWSIGNARNQSVGHRQLELFNRWRGTDDRDQGDGEDGRDPAPPRRW